MVNFSILIPTRNRVSLLKKAFSSIFSLAKDLNNIEVCVACDEDDKSIGISSELSNFNHFNIHYYFRSRSTNLVKDYYNWLAMNFATGKYLIMCNDDVEFTVQDWDKLTYEKLEDYLKDKPDRIVYGATEDLEYVPFRKEENWFSCFPLLSRESVDAMGHFFDWEYSADNADITLIESFKRINRVLDLRKELIIKHISVRSGRREADSLLNTDLSLVIKPGNPENVICENVKALKERINKC